MLPRGGIELRQQRKGLAAAMVQSAASAVVLDA
jgi:hypothetical protein